MSLKQGTAENVRAFCKITMPTNLRPSHVGNGQRQETLSRQTVVYWYTDVCLPCHVFFAIDVHLPVHIGASR